MLIYVSLEKKEALYNLEFCLKFYFIHAANERRMEKWKTCIKNCLFFVVITCTGRVENVQDFSNEGIVGEKSAGKNGMEQLSTLAIESELYAPNDAIKGTFQIFGETKKVREWTLKELQKIYRQHWPGFQRIMRIVFHGFQRI